MVHRLMLLAAALSLFVSSAWAQSDSPFKVIAHPRTSVSKLSKSQVSKMLLGKAARWPDGTRVKPVDQKSSSSLRGRFSRIIHGKSISGVKAYWRQQVFSGRGVPPPERSSDAAIVSYVESTPGAIGYISDKTDSGRAQVISVE